MTAIPPPTKTTAHLIDAHHKASLDGNRYHLGCSMLGHACDRYLWLNFRWAYREVFSGRMRRLFRRGQNEEATVVSDLRAIGYQVHDTDEKGNQWRVDFGQHVSGSMDGVALGVVEAPTTWHVVEIKTHNKKSFDKLEKEGVEKSKPLHYAQMQVYMLGTGLTRALYVSVCKDDDRLYTERVRLDKDKAAALVAKGHRIATANRMPEPMPNASPEWFECKWCPAFDLCHGSRLTQQTNCRTCAHSTAATDGTWHCARWMGDIPNDNQLAGCPDHVLHIDLVPWSVVSGSDDGLSIVYDINGHLITNGHGGQKSAELVAAPELLKDPQVLALMAAGAKLTDAEQC